MHSAMLRALVAVAALTIVAEGFVCPDPLSTSGPVYPKLYPHEQKCFSYHECLRRTAFLLSCPYPLHFNATAQRCLPNVDCGSKETWAVTITTASTAVPTTTVVGTTEPITAAETTPESITTAEPTTTETTPVPLTTMKTTHEPITTALASTEPTTTKPSTARTTVEPAEETFTCLTQERLYPSKRYCWRFWSCSNYNSYLMDCPANLQYHISKKRCEYPAIVDCGDRQPWPEKTTTTTSTTTTTPHWSTSDTYTTLAHSGEPSSTQSIVGFTCPEPKGEFPHYKYCWRLWSCWDSVPTLMDCPQRYLFDANHGYCDDEDKVDCGNRDPRPDMRLVGNDTFVCPEPEGLFPNPEDCESFYSCANSIGFITTCPAGEQFNPTAGVCDFDFNVGCKETSSGLSYVTPDPSGPPLVTFDPNFSCPTLAGNFAYPGDCHYFYKCENGMATLLWCGDGMYFDEQGGFCDVGDCTTAHYLV